MPSWLSSCCTAIDTLAQHWQRERSDHLVNNAGIGALASLMETTAAQFDGLVNAALKGVFFLTQPLLPLMAGGGRIVNLCRLAWRIPRQPSAQCHGGRADGARPRGPARDDFGGVVAALLRRGNRWINARRIVASGGMFL